MDHHNFTYKPITLLMIIWSSQSINSTCLGTVLKYSSLIMKRVNALWPSDAVWRHSICSSLVQVVTCDLLNTNPSPEPIPCWYIDNWTLGNKSWWNANHNTIWLSVKKMYLSFQKMYLSFQKMYLSIQKMYLSFQKMYLSFQKMYMSFQKMYFKMSAFCT